MDEAQIAEQLKQVAPKPEAFAPAADTAPEPTAGDVLLSAELDELTMFKLHDYFGEPYHGINEDSKARAQFIFDNIAEQIGERDYIKVLSKASELEQMIGISHSDNRLYKLYQWLGLDSIRRKTETAMRLING